jgi:hypothetical protein
MSTLIPVGMLAAAKRRPLKVRSAPPAGASAAESHFAMIKRVGKIALGITVAIIVVTGIVALKSYVWIPHFGH